MPQQGARLGESHGNPKVSKSDRIYEVNQSDSYRIKMDSGRLHQRSAIWSVKDTAWPGTEGDYLAVNLGQPGIR